MTIEQATRINGLRANGLEEQAKALEEQCKLETLKLKQLASITTGDLANKINLPTTTEGWLGLFITNDIVMLAMKDEVRLWASQPDPILIFGETGTGKELIARALHGDRVGDFKAINCAGLPKDLVESELFGYVKGSFTGAGTIDKEGLFSAAKGGTVFLDEIGELAIDLQAKLLRALQERTIRRVGSVKEESISCRFIAATHRNLDTMVKEKLFREDLYYRLSTGCIKLLPLSLRNPDADLIARSIDPNFPLRWFEENYNYISLPGNVRSVQQIVRRWQVLGKLPVVEIPIDIDLPIIPDYKETLGK